MIMNSEARGQNMLPRNRDISGIRNVFKTSNQKIQAMADCGRNTKLNSCPDKKSSKDKSNPVHDLDSV